MLKNRLLLSIGFLIINLTVYSQDAFQFWTELGTKGKLYKDLDWTFEMNNRIGQGYHALFPQIGMKYKINSLLKVSGEYRLTFNRDEFRNYESKNRFQFSLQGKERYKRFDFSGRVRYQYDFFRWSQNTFEQKTGHTIRFKPEVLYDINNNPFSPFVNGELFFPLFDLNPKNSVLDKYRLSGGVEFESKSNHSLSLCYIFENTIGKLGNDHIVSFSYSYKF